MKISLLLLILSISGCVTSSQGSLEDSENIPNAFVAFGDLPYTDEDRIALEKDISPTVKKMAKNGEIAFVLHYGDAKAGGEPCRLDTMQAEADKLAALMPKQFIQLPGDNDWTDCDRDMVIKADEVAEAKKVYGERVFYGKDWRGKMNHQIRGLSEVEALGSFNKALKTNQSWAALRHQPGLDENVMITTRDYVFAGLHIVGTNDGFAQLLKDEPKAAVPPALKRREANLAWMTEAFAKGASRGIVVLGLQADMFHPKVLEKETGGICDASLSPGCSGLEPYRAKLRTLMQQYPKTSVLAVHGDTHEACLDQPWAQDYPRFWRLNGPGDFQKDVEAVLVTIHPQAQDRPFEANSLKTGKVFPSDCTIEKK